MSENNRIRLSLRLIQAIKAQADPKFMTVPEYITMVLGIHLDDLGRKGTPTKSDDGLVDGRWIGEDDD